MTRILPSWKKKIKRQSIDHGVGSEPVSTIEIIPSDSFRKYNSQGFKAKDTDLMGTQLESTFEQELSQMEHDMADQEEHDLSSFERKKLPTDFDPSLYDISFQQIDAEQSVLNGIKDENTSTVVRFLVSLVKDTLYCVMLQGSRTIFTSQRPILPTLTIRSKSTSLCTI